MRYEDLYFEDFTVGRRFATGTRTLGEDEIVAFARDYVPLPYHTDPEAAKESLFGGIVAPGFQTAAVTFGLVIATGIFDVSGMGSPGLDRLRWRRPVRPGDTLRVVAEVTAALPARGPKGRNLIKMTFETFNQHDETVLVMHTMHYARSRPK